MTAALRELLCGGDRRSIGAADDIVRGALTDSRLIRQLWTLLADPDALVRMRAADALEKISRTCPQMLVTHRRELLDGSLDDGTAEVRWHLVAMCARLPLSVAESAALLARLDEDMRENRSRIVKVGALQAAFELAARHPALITRYEAMRDFALGSPWPSLVARAKRLGLT